MRRHILPALAACLALLSWTTPTTSVTAAGKRLIKKPTFDASAPEVELFDGIERDQLEARLILKSSLSGSVFIANKTDRPLTVKLPKAVVAVQVLKQGFGAGGGGGRGGGGQGGQGQGGQGQGVGGGFGGGGGGGGLGLGGGAGGGQTGGLGGGFFTVPSQATVQATFTSVCLEHGKAEPQAKMTYKLVPLETYTTDLALQELLIAVGSGELEPGAAQAAAWRLANNMSWETLSAKVIEHLGGVDDEPYFSPVQIAAAQEIASAARAKALERQKHAVQPSSKNRESRP